MMLLRMAHVDAEGLVTLRPYVKARWNWASARRFQWWIPVEVEMGLN